MSEHPTSLRGASIIGALALLVFFRVLVSGMISPSTAYLSNAGLAALLAVQIGSREGLALPGRALGAGLICYFAAGLLSVPWSLMPWSSLDWLIIQTGGLLLFLAVASVGRAALLPVTGAMLVAGAISAAYAVNQRLGGFARTLALPEISEFARMTLREGRVFGLTFSPDMMAAIMAGLLPPALALAYSGVRGARPRMARIALGAAFAALFVATLVLTRSMGGLLAAGAGVALWPLIGMKFSPRRFGLAAVITAAVVLIGGIFVVEARGGFSRLGSAQDPALMRLDNWRTAIRVWAEFPLLGAGGGQYGLAMKLHRSLAGNEAKHVHDTVLESLAETGPLGAAGVVLIFIAMALAGASFIRNSNRPGDDLRAGLFAGGAAVGLHSLIDFDWAAPEVIAIFWIGLATAGTAGRTQPIQGWRRAALAAALLLATAAQLYQAEASRRREAASIAAQAGDWAAARDDAERAIAWDSRDDEMYSLLARAQAETDPSLDRTPLLRQAITLNPRYPFHYRDLGLALRDSDPAAAEAALRRAVTLYPNSLDLNLVLGRFLAKQGRFAEAEPVLDHARTCHFVNGEVLLELGLVRIQLGQEDRGVSDLHTGAVKPYCPATALLSAAADLSRLSRPALAAAILDEWLAAHPESPGRERVQQARDRLGP